jgi:hypothetical protein
MTISLIRRRLLTSLVALAAFWKWPLAGIGHAGAAPLIDPSPLAGTEINGAWHTRPLHRPGNARRAISEAYPTVTTHIR